MMSALCFIMAYGQGTEIIADFRATDGFGNNCYYKIIDATHRYVKLLSGEKSDQWGNPIGTASTFTTTGIGGLPGSVVHPVTGETYYVKSVANLAGSQLRMNNLDKMTISEGIEEVDGFMWCAGKVLVLPTTLKRVPGDGFRENWGLTQVIGLENTQLESIGNEFFTQASSLTTQWKFPPTLKSIGYNALPFVPAQHQLTFPALVETINIKFIDASTTGNISPGLGNFSPTDFIKVVRSENPVPPTIDATGVWGVTNDDWRFLRITINYSPRQYTDADSIYVPIDATAAYNAKQGWNMYANKTYEEVKIGASGYATLYLANENFEVPAGCDAFVIENITKATTPGGLDKANAKKFVAGSIIPAGQAVILKGAANQTCVYQANVSGTPVTITDNMLIGTATDQTINATGYDYYLFGNGPLGQGFYPQTGHDKISIALKAHKAGLRVPKGGGGSAKAFVIDFDAADTYVPTGIQSVKTPQSQTDVIYDLQGRRVTHPTRGIYIMNGKKMVFN